VRNKKNIIIILLLFISISTIYVILFNKITNKIIKIEFPKLLKLNNLKKGIGIIPLPFDLNLS